MTTESNKNRTITLSCMNFFGYVGHVTIFSWMLFTGRVRVRVRIKLSVCLVSGNAHVFMPFSGCHSAA